MSVSQITSFIILIIISSVFQQTHSAGDSYFAVMPQTVTALAGSCVQIPCTFNISNFEDHCNNSKSINGIWLKNKSQFADRDGFIAFNSSGNIIKGFSDIQMTGDLRKGNCKTVFYNIMNNHSDRYFFRLEMEPKVFSATFNTETAGSADSRKTVRLKVMDSPKPPELKPSDLKEVMEETAINLSCSAEAPCPKQPPTISWSNIPESSHITTQLQEKPDKTQTVFSHVTFKASYMDHRKNISCIVTYPRKTSIGNDSTVETTVILRVLFPPKETHIIITPSASVSVGTNVTLTCKTKASPSKNTTFSWYKRGQETPITWEKKISFIVTHNNTGFYFCIALNKHGDQSSAEIQLMVKGQDGYYVPMIAGCVGGIVAVLTLSALGFCARTWIKTHRGDNVGERYSLNQAQDETIDRNAIYDNVLTVTNQDNEISDDQINHNKDSTDEDNHDKGSDVVYAQVHVIHKQPKAISVVSEDIYAQVKT